MNSSTLSHILAIALTMIVSVEQSLPQAGLGTTKKQIVLNGVDTALKATSTFSQATGNTEIANATALASLFVDSTVALLNKAGVFKSTK